MRLQEIDIAAYKEELGADGDPQRFKHNVKRDLEARRKAAQQLVERLAREPFDLARGPLVRAVLLPVGPNEWILSLMMHHIVSDGWSMGVLMSEFGALYRAHAEGRRPELPKLPVVPRPAIPRLAEQRFAPRGSRNISGRSPPCAVSTSK